LQNPSTQLELVRHLTRKTIDDETFKLSNDTLKSDINRLADRAKQLEIIVSQEQETVEFMKQFQEEIRGFAELEISDEEILRDVLQRLIESIEIAADGDISIHYNFINPLSSGA
jgi:site-specific DNA recombinase